MDLVDLCRGCRRRGHGSDEAYPARPPANERQSRSPLLDENYRLACGFRDHLVGCGISKSLPLGPPAPDSVSLSVGSWLEAHATGRGVIAVPIIVVLHLAGAAIGALVPVLFR